MIIADVSDDRHRLDSATLGADRTPGERDFAREVERRLDSIMNPEYRQLTVEALWAIAEMLDVHAQVRLPGLISTDRVIKAAVSRHWRIVHPLDDDTHGPAAWRSFYNLSPVTAAEHLAMAALELAGVVGEAVA